MPGPRLRSSLDNLLFASCVAAILSLTLWAHAHASFRRASLPPEEDLLYLPKPEVLRLVSLGHRELVADLVWVRAVVYAGGQMAEHRALGWLDRYMSTVSTLDPTFRRPYKWAGVISMYNGRIITNQAVEQSNHYLEQGMENFPRDWEFPFMLGCNYLNELKTNDPQKRAAWRQRAGEYIRRAAVIGGGPPWLPLLAASIYTREGQNELAIRHLEEIFAASEDPEIREEVRRRLVSLRAQAHADAIDTGRRELEEARAFAPYLPLDLFIVMGKPLADRSLPQLIHDPLLDEGTVERP